MVERIVHVLTLLQKATRTMPLPMANIISREFNKDPYLILIACLLSLRSRDTLTYLVCKKLFAHARTPQQMLALPLTMLEHILHPINFYYKKARLMHSVSKELLERFNGTVPTTEQELLSLYGVGRKTATLVLGIAFDIPAICVDTHVHKITNRLGWVTTHTPEQTEEALKKIVPQAWWIELNRLLVTWGQNVCVPISPFCSKCAIAEYCPRIGVTKHR